MIDGAAEGEEDLEKDRTFLHCKCQNFCKSRHIHTVLAMKNPQTGLFVSSLYKIYMAI